MKESKVKEIVAKREYRGERNRSWYFTLILENGDKGQLCKNNPDAVKVGDLLKYTVEVKNGYTNFKEPRENNFRQGGFQSSAPSSATIALGIAKDVAVANIIVSGKTLEMNNDLAQKITSMASNFHKWLTEKENGQTK